MSHKLYERAGAFYHDIRYDDANGKSHRVRKRASSDDRKTAELEGLMIEKQLITEAHLGKKPGSKLFWEAAESYIKVEKPTPQIEYRIGRVLGVLEEMGKSKVTLAEFKQSFMDKIAEAMFTDKDGNAKEVKKSTVRTSLYIVVTAILNHAAFREWCEIPRFKPPKLDPVETAFMTPDEAEKLVRCAAPHLRPLLTFMFCTGARLSEALYLDWSQIDLVGRTVQWRATMTKAKKRRVAALCPAALAALVALGPKPIGRVFLTGVQSGNRPYKPVGKSGGGCQIESGWAAARERAGLRRELTPHSCRHTWASWHYAVHKDLLRLKEEGGWGQVQMVERYAHLMPEGQQEAIRRFRGEAPVSLAIVS